MPIKVYKPTTAGRRKASVIDKKVFNSQKKIKSLFKKNKKSSGRSWGKITVRHKGGRAKRLYRLIDFKQDKFDLPGKIISIEYDPNRSCFIGLVCWPDGEKRYILLQDGLKVGDSVLFSRSEIDLKTGNRLPLKFMPSGTIVSNIELMPGRGGQMIRSAGSSAVVMGQEKKYTQLKLSSSEIRLVPKDCLASLGQMSNVDHYLVRLGKAGRKRKKGVRPRVRGKAMNPCDHPHGGGEGNCPIGLVHPKTPWGKPALGVKTRKRKSTNKYIIKRRKKKKR